MKMSIAITPANALFVAERKQVRAVMRRVGSEVAAEARKILRSAVGGGRLYYGSGGAAFRPYQKGRFTASLPGKPPARVTGFLAASIKSSVSRSGLSAAIRDAAPYALFLEAGAKGGGRRFSGGKGKRAYGAGKQAVSRTRILAPRDFLHLAVEKKADSIGPRVQEAIAQGIALRKAAP